MAGVAEGLAVEALGGFGAGGEEAGEGDAGDGGPGGWLLGRRGSRRGGPGRHCEEGAAKHEVEGMPGSVGCEGRVGGTLGRRGAFGSGWLRG